MLSDSKSAVQYFSNCQSVRDNVGVSILNKLKRLSTSHQIHLPWIPSDVDLEGNEIADTLAKAALARPLSRYHPSPFRSFSQKLNTRIRPLGLSPRAQWVSVF
ncbi:hypothetical protein TNCV_2941571 [Trichonephila clavipes]|nr:hypothetical protein TNCV_2941571 [Trichonephila clavipes]